MNHRKCDTLKTGYGWITPDNKCIEVSDPSHILKVLVQECGWVRPFYNSTSDRDDKFYYDLHNFIYSRGYIRVSKYSDTLAVETNDPEKLTENTNLIESIRNKCTHRGNGLKLKKFVVSALDDFGHKDPERYLYFPRQ